MEYKEEEEEVFSESGSESGSEIDRDNDIEDDDVEDVDVDEDDVDPDLSDAEEPQPRLMEFSEDEEEEEENDDDDELNENYLQKLDHDVKQNIISEFHPELNTHSMEEVEASCIPFVTRYEKARAIGERAKQINSGAKPFVEIDQSMIDGYLIALKEFEEKKIPFIIRRPLPNGTSEYWRLSDLEIIA